MRKILSLRASETKAEAASEAKQEAIPSLRLLRTLRVLAMTIFIFTTAGQFAWAESVPLMKLPLLPEDTVLFEEEKMFGYRGRIGGFSLPPSKIGIYFTEKVYYEKGEPVAIPESRDELGLPVEPVKKSIKVMYKKEINMIDNKDLSFCGAYVILLADLTQYQTMSFMIKGEKGQEAFELGMNDAVSNKREDAVYVGSIHRYLPHGVTQEWQMVKVPLEDFYGPDLSQVYSIVFAFNEPGQGSFYIDQLRFHKEMLVGREFDIENQGYLLLDDFDHSLLNLLGRKTNAYKKLPSVCRHSLTTEEKYEGAGSLKLDFVKKGSGWCGYYSLLNQVDGKFYDLSMFKSVSFMVKGKDGEEIFEIGMADRNWVIIGDSLKAGPVTKYLPGGVTKVWQEVIIPLEDFGALDFTDMGSFVINFHKVGKGAIYIDNLKFLKKTEEDMLKEWEEGF